MSSTSEETFEMFRLAAQAAAKGLEPVIFAMRKAHDRAIGYRIASEEFRPLLRVHQSRASASERKLEFVRRRERYLLVLLLLLLLALCWKLYPRVHPRVLRGNAA